MYLKINPNHQRTALTWILNISDMDSKNYLCLFQADYSKTQKKMDKIGMKSVGYPFNFIQVLILTLEALQREGWSTHPA
jgi:hypothetical protein